MNLIFKVACNLSPGFTARRTHRIRYSKNQLFAMMLKEENIQYINGYTSRILNDPELNWVLYWWLRKHELYW